MAGRIRHKRIIALLLVISCLVSITLFFYHQSQTGNIEKAAPNQSLSSDEFADSGLEHIASKAAGREADRKMDETVAMVYLFPNYDKTKKVAVWFPAKDSDIYSLLYQKDRFSELQTAVAYSALYEESDHPHFILIIQTEHFFDSCHACTVVLGGAIFVENDGLWRLKVFNPAITAAGSWGRAPAEMELVKIGPDLHAVAVRDRYMAMGVYGENYFLIGPVGNSIEEIFFLSNSRGEDQSNCGTDETSSNYSSRCWDYDSRINFFQGTDSKFYDIEVISEGTKHDDYGSVAPFRETAIYRFTGCRYLEGPAIEFSDSHRFCIQVGAFERYRSASNMVEKLREAGYPSYCEFYQPNEGVSFFRVRIGNFGSSNKADRILLEIKQLGYYGFVAKR
jgi:hypothetical protein